MTIDPTAVRRDLALLQGASEGGADTAVLSALAVACVRHVGPLLRALDDAERRNRTALSLLNSRGQPTDLGHANALWSDLRLTLGSSRAEVGS